MTAHLISDKQLKTLRARYDEPHRHYHSWTHIEALLALGDDVRALLCDPDTVILAILWHDAIYDPKSQVNEAESAALLKDEMEGLVPEKRLEQAAQLVLATASHAIPLSGDVSFLSDCAFFLDMDLSILGAAAEPFAVYDRGIRAENAHVPEADYRRGRKAVLQGFLDRERLFFTDHFHSRLDARARYNLKRAIEALTM